MSPLDDAAARLDDAVDRLPVVDDRATVGVAVVTLLALLVRLVLLGDRIAHFDEGRVGWWILHFMETGEFHYRYIIHGPFVQHVNTYVFSILGANDFTMRLIVALIGAALPASIVLYREHLRGSEMVAAALFLSFNPVVLYYSRFFRSTIPVATFAFVAFGLLVRLYDTRRPRYLHGAAVALALAFTAKENAAVYVLVWIGAAGLLLDHGLYRPRTADSGLAWLRRWWDRYVGGREWHRLGPRYLGHAVLAAVLFLVVAFYFYAPRAGTPDGVGLWNAFGDQAFGPVIDETLRRVREGYEYWFGGGLESGRGYDTLIDRYLAFAGKFLATLKNYAPVLVAFSVLGFAVERYGTERRRNLVMFASYWGFVSVLGYPLGADIYGAWITVNALVPLAIPAAVGAAMLYRWGRDAHREGDRISVGVVAVVFLLVAGYAGATAAVAVYANPQSPSNGLVQYAQPAGHMRPTLHDVRDLSAANRGTDVLVYGSSLVDRGGRIEPRCTEITQTLPLEWYLGIYGSNVSCADTESGLERALAGPNPPVIITTPDAAEDVRERLSGYVDRTYQLRAPGEKRVFFLDLARPTATATG